MIFSFQEIPINRVCLSDHAFLLRAGRESDPRLAESIRRLGLLHPVLLAPRAEDERDSRDGLRVVSGFERARVCAELGMERLPAGIASASLPAAELLAVAIEDNAAGRGLNLIEQALALEKMAGFLAENAEDDERAVEAGAGSDARGGGENARHIGAPADRVLPLLGRGSSPRAAALLLQCLRFPQAVRDALARGLVPEGAVEALAWFQAEEQELLAGCMTALRMSASACREFARDVFETCRRDGLDAAGLLQQLNYHSRAERGASANVPGAETDGAAVAAARDALLKQLRRLRHPVLSALDARWAAAHAALELAPGVSLRAPKDFEGDRFVLEMRARTAEELAGQAAVLADRAARKKETLEDLFGLQWEEWE